MSHAVGRQQGYSLVEFMVAITVSLLVLATLSSLFVSNMRARREIERANQQIENGRYAVQLLTDDLQHAGYYGDFDLSAAQIAGLTTPTTKPDPCAVSLASLRSALPIAVQGQDGGAAPSCISDLKAGTDIVVVRRVSTCVNGTANCATVAGAPYFQSSLCSNGSELLSLNSVDWYRLDTTIGNLDRTQRDCTTTAVVRRYLTHIYFIANNDKAGDGLPTLKRAELDNGAFTIVPLAQGIENLQVEYGIDTNNDGAPNSFTADPDNFTASLGNCPTTPADCVENWRNALAVKLHVLARTNAPTAGYTDIKTYSLGLTAAGAANAAGPFNDGYKRHVFDTVVRLNNPANRRQ